MTQYDNVSAVRMQEEVQQDVMDEIAAIVYNPDRFVRFNVARNSRTPEWLLGILAEDPHWSVRYKVAERLCTLIGELEKLASDVDARVREAVAGNLNTPKAVLKKLAVDKDARVRRAVMLNKSLTEQEREAIFRHMVNHF